MTNIQDNFLYDCKALESVDLSILTNVQIINNNFLSGCTSLKTIKGLEQQINVVSIRDNFLSNCTKLESVNLTNFINVVNINNNFLSNCSALTLIVGLDNLTNVTNIGKYFLSNCTALQSVDLTAFSKITTLPNSFLHNCNNLTEIVIKTEMNSMFEKQKSKIQEFKN